VYKIYMGGLGFQCVSRIEARNSLTVIGHTELFMVFVLAANQTSELRFWAPILEAH